MLGTAAVSSGALAAALRGGDAVEGAGFVDVVAGLFVLFGFGGMSTCSAVIMSLWNQN